jgi:hypothetical protein
VAEWQARLLDAAAEAVGPNPPRSKGNGSQGSEADAGPADRKLAEVKLKRLSPTITSLVAARRLVQFLESSPIGKTEFASLVGVTDRTLRQFRRTGKLRRSTLDAIARQLGTTVELLLKP